MNIYGLQQSKKRMIDSLKTLYNKKLELSIQLDRINARISQLEKAKNHCNKQIKEKTK